MPRDVFGVMNYFASNELTMRLVQRHWLKLGDHERHKVPVLYQLLGGSVAGLAYWTSCFPLDVIKTKVQSDSLSDPYYKNYFDVWRKTYRQGGVREFYRGFLPCIIRAAPANSVAFTGHAIILRTLNYFNL